MWAQQWGNIYDIVEPENATKGVDVTKLLEEQGYDALKMVQTAEGFFTSLGFEPLPDTFYKRSLITKPADREVQCHASAWDIDDMDDIRIKMCTKVNAEDFSTVHHELGHNFYQRAYKNQPVFFKDGANDGFHEASLESLPPRLIILAGGNCAKNIKACVPQASGHQTPLIPARNITSLATRHICGISSHIFCNFSSIRRPASKQAWTDRYIVALFMTMKRSARSLML